MRTKFKAWTVPYLEEHQEVLIKVEELPFVSFASYSLEIGSGKGQFLIDMATKFPHLCFIGVERNTTCAGITAKKLVENPLNNAKLIYDNADEVLMNIQDNKVDNIFLNFSDPWPKKRHWKRRLSAPQYLESYYRILKKGGRLIIKTDNPALFEFTKEMMENSKFKLISITDDYQEIEEFDAMTEYEKSFRDQGVAIHRLVMEK
ncbi:MAG: tRNA (guanosine(46)-N7)-methyltransferase TrmB [Bacilli bacterium]|nr:tRNA (guanosine(46)-N7)-methyltransferase TrmB [Bacilli bacterium]